MATLQKFLAEISTLLRTKDAPKLQTYLLIEPPFSQIYNALIAEIRQTYAKGREDNLETTVSAALTEARDGVDGGSSWTAFIKFMVTYFVFLRDVDTGNLLATYNLLSELLGKANSALTHPTMGSLILPTVVAYSRMLSRLAIGLDKQPHLIAHLRSAAAGDAETRETLPERAANILRQAFVTCLNDRSGTSASGLDGNGRPEGKKRGIYTIANLCLKILFACRKTRGAAQIFENIYNQSPPLSAFSKAERVTYLYYLGRFLWANSHFYRAGLALQRAFEECHLRCGKQRRLILIYLVAANLACGRFPSAALFSGPEAHGLRERFEPLCRAISKGDVVTFRRLLSPGSHEYAWFSFHRIDLQLRNRCEVFVWRSLVRKCFILCGDPGDSNSRKAPTLDLNALVTLWKWQEMKFVQDSGNAQMATYVDPDFEGLEDLDTTSDEALGMPDMTTIISRVSSLIHQDLLNGYLSMKLQKIAIQGARTKGAIAGGFPNIWQTIQAKNDEEVPGWKKEMKSGGGFSRGAFGPGQVVNLSGVRPVGMA